MALRAWFARSDAQPGAPGLRALTVSREEWRAGGRRIRPPQAADSLALWASEDVRAAPIVRAAFLAERSGLVLSLPVADPAQRRTRDSRISFLPPHACSGRWQTCRDCVPPIRIPAPGCATRHGRKAIGR